MNDLTERETKTLSRIGSRGAYGILLMDLAKENEKVYALSADLGGSSGLSRMMNLMPERFVNTGIAEQNLIGVAAGFAKEGLVPFASSFAPFISGRCFDQIRMNLGYMGLNVKLVALGSGVGMGELGHSHYGWEDVALIRTIPNIVILQPSDCGMIKKCLYAAADYDGPVYIRLTQTVNVPVIYNGDFEFKIGKAIKLREGKEVAIIAAGSMVYQSLKAAEILLEKGFDCTVVDMHTTKPLDTEMIETLCNENKLVVTVEEHTVVGGFGSAVAEFRTTLQNPSRQLIIGLPDCYGHTADYGYQLEKYGLAASSIAEKILEKLNSIN